MVSGVSSSLSYWEQIAALKEDQETRKASPLVEHDSNGDGALDATEFGAFAEKISEMTGETVDAEELFAEMDTDGDGLVSEEELQAAAPPPPPPPEEMLSAMGIDVETLLSMLGSEEETSDTSETAAASGTSGSSETYDPLDTNEDGVVSQEELEAGINSMIAEYTKQMGGSSDPAEVAESVVNMQV